jgi:23S rRNA pseudouridine2605 synthase
MGERLQKFLAQAGLGSRRQIETWIREGRITVDGIVATLGKQVSGDETIQIDGKHLQARSSGLRRRVIAYYKRAGEIVTRHDGEGRPTVFEHLPTLRAGRWIAVGRLDLNTQGLLLLTTDGELASRLMHPSARIEREYAVRVLGHVDSKLRKQLTEGILLEDGLARFDEVVDGGGVGANHWFHVVLREGRNREVRRLWESHEGLVSRLIRVRYGPISLSRELRPGRWEELDKAQVDSLLRAVGMVPEHRVSRSTTPRKQRPPQRPEQRRLKP